MTFRQIRWLIGTIHRTQAACSSVAAGLLYVLDEIIYLEH
jgi:hypothetical protein